MFLITSAFSVAFSTQSDMDEVNTVVKIWQEIQEYADTHNFIVGIGGSNQQHTDYIGKKILGKYNISKDNYFIGVFGDENFVPQSLIVIINMNETDYKRVFIIKNIVEDKCNDPGKCV